MMFNDGVDQFDGLRALPQNHTQFRGHIKDIQHALARRYYLAPELVELCTRVGPSSSSSSSDPHSIHRHADPNGSPTSSSQQVNRDGDDVESYGYDKDFARYYAQQVHRVIAHFRRHTKCNLEVDVDLRYPAGMRLRKPGVTDTLDKAKAAKKAGNTHSSATAKHRVPAPSTPAHQRFNPASSDAAAAAAGQKGAQSLQSPLNSTSIMLVSSHMKQLVNGGKENGTGGIGEGSFIAQPTKSYLFSSPPSKSKSDSQPSLPYHQHHAQGGSPDARTLFTTPSSNDATVSQIVKQERELRDLMDRQNQTSHLIQQQRSQLQGQHYSQHSRQHAAAYKTTDDRKENRTPWQQRHTDKYTGNSHTVVDVDEMNIGNEDAEEAYDEDEEEGEEEYDETELSVAWKSTPTSGGFGSRGARGTDQHREDTQKLFSTPPEFKGFAVNVDDDDDEEDDEDSN